MALVNDPVCNQLCRKGHKPADDIRHVQTFGGVVGRDLEDGIFYILNNLNLRHNNKAEGDKHYKQAVAEMSNEVLENWYDELYQMMLLAYLRMDQVERNAKVKALKQAVSTK